MYIDIIISISIFLHSNVNLCQLETYYVIHFLILIAYTNFNFKNTILCFFNEKIK
jgi:hypothetical protein